MLTVFQCCRLWWFFFFLFYFIVIFEPLFDETGLAAQKKKKVVQSFDGANYIYVDFLLFYFSFISNPSDIFSDIFNIILTF